MEAFDKLILNYPIFGDRKGHGGSLTIIEKARVVRLKPGFYKDSIFKRKRLVKDIVDFISLKNADGEIGSNML